ncbi:hypothetical protein PR048_018166 [Dryococelus australis]|uniref:Retrotransposon gag domain-containing protein n=1 Tax=Dryococelus australis TaxID=614101 RepID=A0ABQ9HBP2_9NEOP|nr:hypothetical protein PR048_018166 [Dryococelus australis]
MWCTTGNSGTKSSNTIMMPSVVQFCFWREKVQILEAVLDKFDAYFLPRRNLTYERQREGQTLDTYFEKLRKKSETCERGAMRDDLIKDSIAWDIRDNALKERLLREHNITLIQTIDTCRAAEVMDKQLEMFQEEAAVVQEVVTCSNVRLRNSALQNNDTTRLRTDQ